jgi:hypothetical protein
MKGLTKLEKAMLEIVERKLNGHNDCVVELHNLKECLIMEGYNKEQVPWRAALNSLKKKGFIYSVLLYKGTYKIVECYGLMVRQ